jgi:hypothetical protein
MEAKSQSPEAFDPETFCSQARICIPSTIFIFIFNVYTRTSVITKGTGFLGLEASALGKSALLALPEVSYSP